MSIEIKGAEQLAALYKDLRSLGERDLQREMNKRITQAVKPIRPAVRAEARRRLPKRGGLAARVAKASITTRKRTGRQIAGVRVVMSSSDSLRAIDRGRVRHPVFNTGKWVTQQVPPGFFSDPTEDLRQPVQRALLAGMADISRKLSRR